MVAAEATIPTLNLKIPNWTDHWIRKEDDMTEEQRKAILALLNGLTVKGLDDCRRVVMVESIVKSIPVKEDGTNGEKMAAG